MRLWPASQCQRVRGLASPFLDGRLAAAVRATVQQHLHDCGACVHDLQQLARLSRAMHNLPPFRIADGMASRVRRELSTGPGLRAATPSAPHSRGRRRAAAIAALVTAAATLFGLGFLCGRHESNVPASPIPANTVPTNPAPEPTAPAPPTATHATPVRLQPRAAPAPMSAPFVELPAPPRANAQFATFGDSPPAAPVPPQRRAMPDARELLDEMLREMFGQPPREPPRHEPPRHD